MNIEDLDQYIKENNEYTSRVAEDIKSVLIEFKNGNIDAATAKELIDDAIEVAIVDDLAESLDIKIKIKEIANIAQSIMDYIK